MRLTKPQRVMLRMASDLGGTIRIFADQWSTVGLLEASGLMTGNGKHIDRMSSITDLGRAALAQSVEKK